MTELYPSDTVINALSGTSDTEQDVAYPAIYEAPYYTTFYKMLYRLLDVARRAGDLRVYKDGALTFGVRAGKFFHNDQLVEFTGATGQTLTNNAVNYVYLNANGTLIANTTGFPVPSMTPHIRLAMITASGGAYDHDDILDQRGSSFIRLAGVAEENLLRLDWQESVAGELNFTTAEPVSPSLGDRYLNTHTGASSQTAQAVFANALYQWNGQSWTESTPDEGACCLVENTDMLKAFNGTSWVSIGTFALLNEAQTFFSGSDITAAEAESLTNGSNANPLHVHGVVCVNNETVCYENELVYA